jgi:hypothetical protein
MTSPKKKSGEAPPGAYCFGYDYSFEQFQFLRSVERLVPEVLKDLRKSVLPLFIKKQRNLQSSGCEGPLFLPTAHDELPPHPRPEDADIPGYDPETWPAIWEWAHRWRLIETDELPKLQTREAVAIALNMDRDYFARSFPSREERGPFSHESSSIIFALPALSRVVLLTLQTWSAGRATRKLAWSFPELDLTVYDFYGLQHFRDLLATQRVMLDQIENRDSKLVTPDPPPWVYEFYVQAWHLRRETREQAQDRIRKNLID